MAERRLLVFWATWGVMLHWRSAATNSATS
jgi:hypothetical protein